MSEAEYMEDGADYLKEGCQRQTCDGCMAYNYCLIKEQEDKRWEDMMVDAVNDEPTAYDPDKVVEQLEERTAFLKDCTKYGNKTEDQQSKSYDTMMMYEVKDLVDDLLEIVKAGGSDGD